MTANLESWPRGCSSCLPRWRPARALPAIRGRTVALLVLLALVLSCCSVPHERNVKRRRRQTCMEVGVRSI